ncbi:MAG: hypothetical protein ABIG68_10745 [Acidobacteriota bacterium]
MTPKEWAVKYDRLGETLQAVDYKVRVNPLVLAAVGNDWSVVSNEYLDLRPVRDVIGSDPLDVGQIDQSNADALNAVGGKVAYISEYADAAITAAEKAEAQRQAEAVIIGQPDLASAEEQARKQQIIELAMQPSAFDKALAPAGVLPALQASIAASQPAEMAVGYPSWLRVVTIGAVVLTGVALLSRGRRRVVSGVSRKPRKPKKTRIRGTLRLRGV